MYFLAFYYDIAKNDEFKRKKIKITSDIENAEHVSFANVLTIQKTLIGRLWVKQRSRWAKVRTWVWKIAKECKFNWEIKNGSHLSHFLMFSNEVLKKSTDVSTKKDYGERK